MSRIVIASSLGLVFALLIAGCSRPAADVDRETSFTSFEKPRNAEKATPEDRAALARDNTAFAFDLHRQLPRDGNLITSPFAISTVLSMCLIGAEEETGKEMKQALRFSLAPKAIPPAFASLLWDLAGGKQSPGYRLRLANALWTDRSIELTRVFSAMLKSNYSSAGQVVDFKERDKACRTINAWAKEQTGGEISDVISPEELHPLDRFLLTSAVSFRGQWAKPFSTRQTQVGPFHVSRDRTVKIPLMTQEEDLQYYSSGKRENDKSPVRLVVLPFRGSVMQFVVLLPHKPDGLNNLEKTLTPDVLNRWIEEAGYQKVNLTLPRFTMRTKRLSLNKPLETLGMKKAFEEGANKFPGISTTLPLRLARVMQEAMVTVDEEGARAAAVADAKGRDKGKEPEKVVFRADRPFLFLIRHKESGTVLFLGRVVNPAAG
jgi:serpin B